MPAVPAFCDTCGTVFNSGFFVENSREVSFAGNRSGPCPKCGGMGHVPDGVFNFIGNTIEILSAPERTHAELMRLAEILRQAKERSETKEQVAERIEKEVPGLAKLAGLLPSNRAELYGFLGARCRATPFPRREISSSASDGERDSGDRAGHCPDSHGRVADGQTARTG
jgi:hypothetical protein